MADAILEWRAFVRQTSRRLLGYEAGFHATVARGSRRSSPIRAPRQYRRRTDGPARYAHVLSGCRTRGGAAAPDRFVEPAHVRGIVATRNVGCGVYRVRGVGDVARVARHSTTPP